VGCLGSGDVGGGLGSWPDNCVGGFLGESLAMVTPMGESPVHLGHADGGILDVTTFLKVSLLKFVSVTSSPFSCCFCFSVSCIRVEVWSCSVKSELLRQGMWLGNNDVRRAPLLRGLDCFGGLAFCRDGAEVQVWKCRW
jgi:hypothetical protein